MLMFAERGAGLSSLDLALTPLKGRTRQRDEQSRRCCVGQDPLSKNSCPSFTLEGILPWPLGGFYKLGEGVWFPVRLLLNDGYVSPLANAARTCARP